MGKASKTDKGARWATLGKGSTRKPGKMSRDARRAQRRARIATKHAFLDTRAIS